MKSLASFSTEEKEAFHQKALADLERYKAMGLKVDMSRGKPSPDQLALSDALYHSVDETHYKSEDGTDCRNYGGLTGIEEARRLFAEILEVQKENVIVCGSSSLALMFDYIAQCMTHGCGEEPWLKQGRVKMLAVVPGYDRHFTIADYFGIELINVHLTPEGPNMDEVEKLIQDPMVKGMFCVPKYSNPDGVTYSAEVVERLAAMTPAAKDFRVIYDNAYVVHDLYEETEPLREIFSTAKKYGHENHFIEFSSTSKITYSGAGISAIAASDENIAAIKERMSAQIISYDKMNQLRHTNVFHSLSDIKLQMKKHADLIRPKFEIVEKTLEEELADLKIAHWTNPRGGYFISFYVDAGSAKRVGQLCKEAGLTLTTVGSTYPSGIDPYDSNIRIAPTFPSQKELKLCVEIFCAAVRAACSE